ncbi:hypothetical protein FLAVO9AF_610012 [Flavobacterium sp. 9AF]|uniref:hypothetical protein n=1 Tax=Flavobacterium sp. 9AF TaxID=2653142 RepID=UPI0012F1D849|nr:hypothetical protein [Flavobacterium sp. 9AF]VXC15760.1 hypothetical protein FLAVO9AF_610012 [Flavobacterium sp. 9AF]
MANYDNYFIGEFNGELLVSTETFIYGRSVGNTLQDSVTADFYYAYKIANTLYLKTPFIYFTVYELIEKFDSINQYIYNDYNDFYTFFNRNELEYHSADNYKNTTPEIIVRYIDYSILIDNTGIVYNSTDFGKPPYNENNFRIENIREIENPNRGIELTYSFNCTLLSDSNELIEIEKGKGKCTFWY